LCPTAGVDQPGTNGLLAIGHDHRIGEIDHGADVGGHEADAVADSEAVHLGAAEVAVLLIDAHHIDIPPVGGRAKEVEGRAVRRECLRAGIDQGQSGLGPVDHGGKNLDRDIGGRHHASRPREGEIAKHIRAGAHRLHAAGAVLGDHAGRHAAAWPDRQLGIDGLPDLVKAADHRLGLIS
jgi:hypothetical protein